MTASRMSAFFWDTGEPTVFSQDPSCVPYSNGKTRSQVMREVTDAKTAKTGRNPGTLRDLSSAADQRINATEAQRRKR